MFLALLFCCITITIFYYLIFIYMDEGYRWFMYMITNDGYYLTDKMKGINKHQGATK